MTDAAIPKTPAGTQLTWVLDVLRGDDPTIAEVRKRFSTDFLRQVPPEMFGEVLGQVRPMVAGFTLARFETDAPTGLIGVLETLAGSAFRLHIAVDGKPPHKITGLFVQAAFDLRKEPAAKSWRDVDDKLSRLGARVNLLAAEIVGDALAPVHALNADEHLAIGSTFKLYVLGALAEAIADGSAAWDEEIAVSAKRKSLPSGVMQDEKAGKRFSLETYAEQMISISDNTATDHVLFRVGRDTVESVQTSMGHRAPELNVPFLSTREMFVLKFTPASVLTKSFVTADPTTRRKLLDTKVAGAKLPAVKDIDLQPGQALELEWFASATDLAFAMVWLRDAMDKPELAPLKRVLSVNPGLPFDRYAWAYIGFKGGSEPGVLNMTWLLKRLDDRWFVLTASVNDDSSSVDVMEFSALMLSSAALLTMHRKKPSKDRITR